MKKLSLILIASFCIMFTNCKKEEVAPTETPVVTPVENPSNIALTEKFTAFQEGSLIPGFAVTVVKNNELAYQKSFGQAILEADMPYTNQTVQPIGSISKTFIGAALMKAIEQGYFTLETNINDILPFEINNPNHPNVPIKIKHLVTHTSSFEDSDEAYEYHYYIREGEDLSTPVAQLYIELGLQVSSGMALGDYLKEVYTPEGVLYDANNFAEHAPGTYYDYSNISSSLAAYLIEVKTGQSYADFVGTHILSPLGMNNTTFDRLKISTDQKAALYIGKGYPIPEYAHPSYPDGFLNASNEDMGKYLMEMMKGAAGQGTILSQESYQLLFEQKTPQSLIDQDEDVHAVFWDLEDGRIGHDGADPGAIAFLSFDPQSGNGLFLMANINDVGLGEAFELDIETTFEQLLAIYEMASEFEQE